MEGQLSLVVEELFQHVSEQTIIFDCAGKLQFMNERMVDTLQQLKLQTSFSELLGTNNEKWLSFIQTVTQDNTARAIFYLSDTSNQRVAMEMSGYYLKENQLIFSRVQFMELPENLSTTAREIQLMNSLPHGVILATLNGKIIATNSQSLQLLGFEVGQLERRSYELLFEHCYYEPEMILHYYRMIALNDLATIVVKRVCSDGHINYLSIASKIDEVLGLLVTTITDQTEQMRLLEKINHQKALSVIGENAASIVHEIRNPMTAIQGFIQMIKENLEDQASPYFEIVEAELQHIDDMLVDILTLAKPSSYEAQMLDFKDVVEQAITLFQLKALELNTSIIFEYDEQASYKIKGNHNRLKQMLINLLKNAIEAVESNGHILIQLVYQNETTLRLIVEDRGKGMSPEQKEQAFHSFYTTKPAGTGLGLLLVQAVVAEHNGELILESTEGVGTRFIIDFVLNLYDFSEIMTTNPVYLTGKQQNYI